ncbi:MAG: hypothetical protein ABL958_08230 [Bdellovibrionia bacterium]
MLKRIFLTALIFTFSAACSKDDAEQTVKNPKLIELGTVQEVNTRPALINILGGYERDSLQFAGNDVTKTVDVYASQDGSQPIITIFYKGTYTRGNDIGNDTWELDLNYTSVEVVARTDAAVKVLNTLSFCGKNDFATGVNANLSATSAEATCPLDDVPFSRYDIYKVEGDKVYFGTGDKTTKETRPKDLDRDHPFVKRG